MGTQTQFIKMTQIGMWMVEGERNRKQKKGENLCLLNICCVWNIKSITHIPPFNPHNNPLSRRNDSQFTDKNLKVK